MGGRTLSTVPRFYFLDDSMTAEEHADREPQPGDLVEFEISEHTGKPQISYKCPACGYTHTATVMGTKNHCDATWKWNESYDAPTLDPSMNSSSPAMPEHDIPLHRCHHWLRAGKVDCCQDCTHENNGVQQLPVEPWRK